MSDVTDYDEVVSYYLNGDVVYNNITQEEKVSDDELCKFIVDTLENL